MFRSIFSPRVSNSHSNLAQDNYNSTRTKLIACCSLIAFIILAGTGCKKFLTTEILGVYPETEFYQTQSQAVLAINAAYQPLSFSAPENRLWVFGDVASDDAAKGGVAGDQADIGLID